MINIIKTIWGSDIHTDLVQFKIWINNVLDTLNNKDLSQHEISTKMQYYKQLLSNKTLNALIIASQNNVSYMDLYQATL